MRYLCLKVLCLITNTNLMIKLNPDIAANKFLTPFNDCLHGSLIIEHL